MKVVVSIFFFFTFLGLTILAKGGNYLDINNLGVNLYAQKLSTNIDKEFLVGGVLLAILSIAGINFSETKKNSNWARFFAGVNLLLCTVVLSLTLVNPTTEFFSAIFMGVVTLSSIALYIIVRMEQPIRSNIGILLCYLLMILMFFISIYYEI